MLSAEKAVYLDLCAGLSVGHQWLNNDVPKVAQNQIPDTVLLEGQHLAELALLYKSGDHDAGQVVEGLIEKADEVMKRPVVSVTDKRSADNADLQHLNDYSSLAKYWWPESTQNDGLHYVRRDGEVNPECYSQRFDNERLVFMAESLQVLSLVAYFTEDPVWVRRAIEQLEAWFISPETRQTPHFKNAQHVPGKDSVRSSGIVESRHLIYVIEAIYILEFMGVIHDEMSRNLRQWFSELLFWMRTSDMGRAADRAKNNIAYWYDVQCLAYAWFTKDKNLAERIILDRVQGRSLEQIEQDGSLPLELDRANPLDYVVFTLAAMAQISRYSDRLSIPVWRQEDADGRSFYTAHEWLLQQMKVREGKVAARCLSGAENEKNFSRVEDLVLQMAMSHRLADSRGKMIKERDRWQKEHVRRINELENLLEKSEKNVSKAQKGEGLQMEKLEKERLEWIEKKLIETKDKRIKELQDRLKSQNENQKIKEKQQKLQETIQAQKVKVSTVENRLKDVRHQFDVMLEEKNAEINRLKENEKRFDELLKNSEQEMQKLAKKIRSNDYDSSSGNIQTSQKIENLKKKHSSEIRSQQRKIDRLQQGLDQHKKRADYFKTRSDRILKSRSWRMTGLLRRALAPFGGRGADSEKKT